MHKPPRDDATDGDGVTGNDYTMPRGFATHFAIAVASDSVGRTADDVGLGGENPKRRRAAAVSIVEFKLYS